MKGVWLGGEGRIPKPKLTKGAAEPEYKDLNYEKTKPDYDCENLKKTTWTNLIHMSDGGMDDGEDQEMNMKKPGD